MSEFVCNWCKAVLKDNAEIYVADYETFCNSDCYCEWLLEVYDPGYRTVLSEYEREMNRIESKWSKPSRTIKAKCYGKKIICSERREGS